MSNWVQIVGTESRLASKVRSAVDQTQRDKDTLVALKAMLDEIAAGPDWAALCAALGWADTEANQTAAQSVYNNVTNAAAVLAGADIRYYLTRLG